MGIQRVCAVLAAGAVAVGVLAACDDGESPLLVRSDGTVASRTAAAVYAGAVARTGMPVRTLDASSSQDSLLEEVAEGDLGMYPAFTGDLLAQLTPHPTAVTADDVLADVNRSLPEQVSIGDPALVSDRWQMLAAQRQIEASGVESLADCGRFPAALPLIVTETPPRSVLDAAAGCAHGPVQRVDSIDELVTKVRSGEALGFATALDTAGAGALDDVQALKSDGAPVAQQLVPVFASGQLEKSQLKALSRVAGELTTTDLAQMMREVRDGADPRAVAGQWLATRGV